MELFTNSISLKMVEPVLLTLIFLLLFSPMWRKRPDPPSE